MKKLGLNPWTSGTFLSKTCCRIVYILPTPILFILLVLSHSLPHPIPVWSVSTVITCLKYVLNTQCMHFKVCRFVCACIYTVVEKSDRMRSTGEGNGKPLQYSCLQNPTNSMKRQNDSILKEELPRSVGAQHATGDQWEITPERMKGWSQSKNNTQLQM